MSINDSGIVNIVMFESGEALCTSWFILVGLKITQGDCLVEGRLY